MDESTIDGSEPEPVQQGPVSAPLNESSNNDEIEAPVDTVKTKASTPTTILPAGAKFSSSGGHGQE